MKIARVFVVLFSLVFLGGRPDSALAFFWDDNQDLVTINETTFTTEDYQNWWSEWQENDMPVPEKVDEFVDWVLLSQEAKAMQLDQTPEYRKKLAIFLKVRALMQLKQDEVSSRTQIPDDKILWETYLKEHTPLVNLRLVAVDSEEQAAVVRRFLDSGVSLTEAVKSAGLEKVADLLESTGLMRARKLPDPIREAVLPVAAGAAGGPVAYGHVWYFFEVVERNDGSQEDFASLKNELIRQSLKNQENQLTRELSDFLTKKFQVTVNEEVIARMTPEGLSAADADQTVLQIGNTVVSGEAFYQAVLKEQELRGGAHRNAEAFDTTKKRIVSDAIVQTVTGLEALDRHYEERPPLKQIFEFYSQHRLIKELEKTLIGPEVEVSESDAKAYYEEHPEQFSREDIVELAVVQTNETALAEKLAKRLKAGEDFFMVMQPLAPAGIETRRSPVQHLNQVLQDAVAKMSPGQVSGALHEGEDIFFIKLIRAGEREFIPFEKISEQLVAQLQEERFAKAKAQLIEQLRSLSTIKVNDRVWGKLKKRLTAEGAGNHES